MRPRTITRHPLAARTDPVAFVLVAALLAASLAALLVGGPLLLAKVEILFAVAIALFLAFRAPDPSWRVALIVFILISNLPFELGLPAGAFAVVVLASVVRDWTRLYTRREAWLPLLILTSGYLLFRSASPFTMRVVGGLVLFTYLTVLRDCLHRLVVAFAGAAGVLVNAAFTLVVQTGPVSSYYAYIDDQLVLIERVVDARLDPNAVAALVLLGMGGCLALLLRRGAWPLLGVVAVLAGAASIAATGSRTGMIGAAVAAAIFLVQLLVSRGRSPVRIVLAVTGFAIAASIVVTVLSSTNLGSRYTLLGGDLAQRTDIWGGAANTWVGSPETALLGTGRPGADSTVLSATQGSIQASPEDLAAEGSFAPHNSILEILVLYGVVGVVLIVMVVLSVRHKLTRPFSSPWQAGAWAVLLQTMVIGLSAQYLLWVGLALVLPCPRRRADHEPSPSEAASEAVSTRR